MKLSLHLHRRVDQDDATGLPKRCGVPVTDGKAGRRVRRVESGELVIAGWKLVVPVECVAPHAGWSRLRVRLAHGHELVQFCSSAQTFGDILVETHLEEEIE